MDKNYYRYSHIVVFLKEPGTFALLVINVVTTTNLNLDCFRQPFRRDGTHIQQYNQRQRS